MKHISTFLFSFLMLTTIQVSAQMPNPVFDVTTYGAVGDGTILNTAAIQAAIDACTGTGGSVYLHDGTFKTGTITLKSNMTFYIAKSATLLGDTADLSYPVNVPVTDNWELSELDKALVYCNHATNLTITGGGTIDGNGTKPKWINVFLGNNPDELDRPIPIWIVQSNKVRVTDITIKDGAMWNFVPFESDSITIRNVTIKSNIVANRDGIDIVDCHDVLIEGCNFYVDDDAICPKSGTTRGVRNVVVRNCNIQKSGRANGIKFGTMGYGSFKNMLFEDITINDVNLAGIAIESVDGADVDSIIFRRITMNNVGSPIFVCLGDRGRVPTGGVHKMGTVKNILFQDITATGLKQAWGCPVTGFVKNNVTYNLQNITFDNVDVTFNGGVTAIPAQPAEFGGQYPEVNMWGNLPAYGYYVRHADGVSFTDCDTKVTIADARPWLTTSGVVNLSEQNNTNPTALFENLVNATTHISDSGFANAANLWDGLTNNGSNDSKATGAVEAWVEFDFGANFSLTTARLWEDNGGNQISHWKVMSWNGTEWVDIFPYMESNTSGWQVAEFNITTDKIRFYAKCTSGGVVSIHELEALGTKLTTDALKETTISDFSIYQNPTSEVLHFQKAQSTLPVDIYNVYGVKLITTHDVEFNVSKLVPGVYFARVISQGKILNRTFIKR